MSLLVGLILTALNGPVGTESRGVAGFANLDTVPLNLFKITFFFTFSHRRLSVPNKISPSAIAEAV